VDSDGTIASYNWTKISGSGFISPGTGSSNGSVVAITGLTVGTSVFRLTVTDNLGATGYDDLNVVVNPAGTGGGGTGVLVGVPVKYVFVGKMFWYLVTMAYVFEKFLHWWYSVFIVTNERIVDIDFVNLVYRVVSYANLNHIEEPTMVTGGFIRSMFQIGNVFVTTASEKPSVEAIDVPYPQKVVDIL
jgi:membrane protein YdbS with pleckstrin-like domain